MLSTWRWRAPHQHAARAMPFDPPSSCAVATAIVPTLHRRKPRCREGRLARGRTATGRACSCPRTSGVRFFYLCSLHEGRGLPIPTQAQPCGRPSWVIAVEGSLGIGRPSRDTVLRSPAVPLLPVPRCLLDMRAATLENSVVCPGFPRWWPGGQGSLPGVSFLVKWELDFFFFFSGN